MTQLSPNASTLARDLSVKLTAAPGVGNSRTFTLRDDALDTALSCAISGTATTCTSSGPTATITAGSELSFGIVDSGTPAGGSALIGWRAAAP